MIGYCNDIITTSQQTLKKGKLKLNLKIQNTVPNDSEITPFMSALVDENFQMEIEMNAFGRLDESTESHVFVIETKLNCRSDGSAVCRLVLSANQSNADGQERGHPFVESFHIGSNTSQLCCQPAIL